jgi:hypothetical protein
MAGLNLIQHWNMTYSWKSSNSDTTGVLSASTNTTSLTISTSTYPTPRWTHAHYTADGTTEVGGAQKKAYFCIYVIFYKLLLGTSRRVNC